MGWFRSNSGRFAWLAFFALACQFALTFGHIHLGNIGVISAALTASVDSADVSTSGQSSPAQQVPTGLTQDFCAVCSNISLASALVLPVSPSAAPPLPIIRDMRWPLVTAGFASSDHFHFNARGPPHT
jgi:hypothetical protein